MTDLRRPASRVVLLLLVPALGCLLRPQPDPTRYYTLSVEAPAAPPSRALRLGVGPVAWPGYLRRPGLAVRLDASRVGYAELDRWAEPLEQQFVRVFGENLGRRCGASEVVLFPWFETTSLDVVVQVAVTAFENDGDGTARLAASWTVREGTRGRRARHGVADILEPAHGPDAEARVRALSRAVARLAEEIAPVVEAAPAEGLPAGRS